MHELGMCEAVLAAVEQRARGRPVAGIGVRAGTLLRVEPEAFQASFELVAAGGIAADAVTEVTTTGLQARCTACGLAFETADPIPACPRCSEVRVERHGGDELVLEWVRYRSDLDDRAEPEDPTPETRARPTGS